jgi:hypothetical protein
MFLFYLFIYLLFAMYGDNAEMVTTKMAAVETRSFLSADASDIYSVRISAKYLLREI